MPYRNITVNGVDYKYTVGRVYVKVRGLGAWPKEDIGELIYDMNWGEYIAQVRPEHVAAKIRETVRLNT